MNFLDLYRYVDNLGGNFVPVKEIRSKIIADSSYVGDIIFYSMPLDKKISRGHIRVFRERTSPYSEEYNVLSIRISKNLNRCWKRFVLCKEMMHAFDPSISRTNNAEKFKELLDELEHNPLLDNASKQYESERTAEWQALFILCPKEIRKKCIELHNSGKNRREIADIILIPEVYIGTIITDRYEKYHELIVGEPIQ